MEERRRDLWSLLGAKLTDLVVEHVNINDFVCFEHHNRLIVLVLTIF